MGSSGNIQKQALLGFGAVVVLAALVWGVKRGHQSEVQPPAAIAIASPTKPAVAAQAPPDHSLDNFCAELRAGSDASSIRQKLARLRTTLANLPKDEAVARIRRFLDSKADAPTHLPFKVAPGGLLAEAPTLRTFLLDELGRIDPAAAAACAKTILDSMDSADEWAVALRNLARGDSSADARSLLEQKATQMLQYAPWQQSPSTGYLEAFDVPVYLGGADFVPTLLTLVRGQDNPAIAHAAYLALDRLVINNPASVLQAMESSPDLMAGRESTRADYFARANVSDPQQLQVLQNYLLNPAISDGELQTFAGIFPNANFMISDNLLTQNVTLTHDALANLDAQTLATVQQWESDPRFTRVATELQTIAQRLQGFAAQARRGP